jgi:hypothetical protein
MKQIKQLTSTLALVLALITVSCNRPECQNTNPIFDKYPPFANEYKAELVRQMRSIGQDKLKYWFDRLERRENKDYMIVYVQGDKLCAKGYVRVLDWNDIENLRDHGGYSGAGLRGLRLNISETNGQTELVYAGVDKIID